MDSETLVRLEIPSRIAMLETADTLVDGLARKAGFDEESREDIRVAVHESLVNAIVHGNHGDPGRRVTLQVVLDRHGLEVRVHDEGRGFDPDRVPDPLAPENLSRPSGRGILLMRTLMDDVRFRRPSGGGTEVTLRKSLAGADGRAAARELAAGN